MCVCVSCTQIIGMFGGLYIRCVLKTFHNDYGRDAHEENRLLLYSNLCVRAVELERDAIYANDSEIVRILII